MSDAPPRPRTAGDALLSPLPCLAIALLLLNDHVLKAAWPGPVTGKLISEMVLDGAPSHDLTPLRVDRYS